MKSTITYRNIPLVSVPEGKAGDWQIDRFKISRHDAVMFNLRAGPRGVIPGKYTRLTRKNTVVMSDTPAERADHVEPVQNAKGRILINGLGLGMVLQAAFDLRGISHATVIEQSAEVISLSAPFYQERYGDKLEIINADALEYTPPKSSRFEMVWHDIWDTIDSDNLAQMATLHRRYGRFTDWQGSWCHRECLAQRRKESQPFSFWR